MKIGCRKIEFLGVIIGQGQVELHKHISANILEIPNKLEGLTQIKSFLRKLNYARNFISNLSQLAGSLYSKTKQPGEWRFNNEDIKLAQKINDIVRKINLLNYPSRCKLNYRI